MTLACGHVVQLARLLPVASVLALVLAWTRLRAQPANGRLFAETFGLARVALALVWAAWLLLWLIEQRW
jgi:hypothetical protein